MAVLSSVFVCSMSVSMDSQIRPILFIQVMQICSPTLSTHTHVHIMHVQAYYACSPVKTPQSDCVKAIILRVDIFFSISPSLLLLPSIKALVAVPTLELKCLSVSLPCFF